MVINIILGVLIAACIGGYIGITLYQKKKGTSTKGGKKGKIEKLVNKKENTRDSSGEDIQDE